MYNLYENTAHLYDLEYRDHMLEDIRFYIGYAQKQKGKILELACGTGRVALALADKGFHVTGLDLSEQMLAVFREKLAKKPDLNDKIELIHGNMANFNINRKFTLIIVPYRAFQALTDDRDVDSSLACVQNHLADNGLFIVSAFYPLPPLKDKSWRYDETVQWERLDEETGNTVVKKMWGNEPDTVNHVVYPSFAFEVTYPDGSTERLVDHLAMKCYYPEQLTSVIKKAGMEVAEEYSWYDKKPLYGAPVREIIYVCKKKT